MPRAATLFAAICWTAAAYTCGATVYALVCLLPF